MKNVRCNKQREGAGRQTGGKSVSIDSEKRTAVFKDDLAYSHEAIDKPFLTKLFKDFYGDDFIEVHVHNEDGPGQRAGCDGTVLLRSGAKTFDVKTRRTRYDDILLEYEKNDKTGAPGWVADPDLACDLIVYVILPRGEAYILPCLRLQRTFSRKEDEWLDKAEDEEDGFSIRVAENRGYNTLNLAIPAKTLLADMYCVQF